MPESGVETATEMGNHLLLVLNVWQSARIFHPASMSLCIRQLDTLEEYIVDWAA